MRGRHAWTSSPPTAPSARVNWGEEHVPMSRFALVTGGTDGIGAATAEALVAAGYRVVSTYGHDVEKAHAFTERTQIPTWQFDVADVLVNDAGIAVDKVLHKMDAATWHKVVETNLTGCFNMSRAVINGMRDRKFGRIVNISSLNGQIGQFGQA